LRLVAAGSEDADGRDQEVAERRDLGDDDCSTMAPR
jgi:hypothetical protein